MDTAVFNSPAVSEAECDEGDTVLSGSYALLNPARTSGVIDRAFPTHDGWNASAFVGPGISILLQTFAQCFDNPTAHVSMASAAISAFQQQQPEDAVIMSQGLVNSPAISQVTEDSPELTTTEKITKLKQQWLELLP